MYGKLLGVAFAALISTSAMAQTAGTASAKHEWQASKLIGVDVYNSQNQKIGDIKELLVDKDGKIETIAIGVGGFLGVGERDVAVKFDQLNWSNRPVSSASNSKANSSTTGAAPAADNANRTYPDHAVLNATKDQLKAMPQFDYNK